MSPGNEPPLPEYVLFALLFSNLLPTLTKSVIWGPPADSRFSTTWPFPEDAEEEDEDEDLRDVLPPSVCSTWASADLVSQVLSMLTTSTLSSSRCHSFLVTTSCTTLTSTSSWRVSSECEEAGAQEEAAEDDDDDEDDEAEDPLRSLSSSMRGGRGGGLGTPCVSTLTYVCASNSFSSEELILWAEVLTRDTRSLW